MNKAAFSVVAAGAVVLGLAFRLAWLDLRPMHHDEANQAVRFGQLLETGEYRYDRNDHHGPTLYYLTLPGGVGARADDAGVARRADAACRAGAVRRRVHPAAAADGPRPRARRRGGGHAAGRAVAGAHLLQPVLHPGIGPAVLRRRVPGGAGAVRGRRRRGGDDRGRRVRRAGAGDQGDRGADPAGGGGGLCGRAGVGGEAGGRRARRRPTGRGRRFVSLMSSAAWSWRRSSR